MRYLILIILLGLGGLAIYQASQNPAKKPILDQSMDDGESGEVPLSSTQGAKTSELAGLEVPAMSDPLAETIFDILKGLIEGQLGESDRLTLIQKMTQAMDAEKLGDEVSLGNAAKTAVDRMLREAESARAAGAPTGPMTRFQREATIAMSGRFSGSLRRAMRASREGVVHDQELLTVDLDFDVPDGYQRASWDIIGSFHYVEGMKLPASVMALHKQKVGLAGFMMALGEFEDIHIFAVVESQWSCCFGTPPDIHQIIEVTIPDKAPGYELTQSPILVLGTLDVGEVVEDGWVVSVYRMSAESVDVLE